MMFRVFVYALGTIALIGGIAWFAAEDNGFRALPRTVEATGPHESISRDSNEDSPLPRLEKQLQLLQEQLRAQQQDLRQQQKAISRLADALAMNQSSEPKALADNEEPAQPEEEQEQIRAAQLDSEFSEQQIDHEWSRQAASQITAAVEKVLNDESTAGRRGTSLVDAHCRATICRITLVGETLEAINSFSQSLPLHLGWQTDINQTTTEEPDGSVRSILYLSKDTGTVTEAPGPP